MIVYVPTPITSVEQAEALPEGSAVVRLDTPWIATKRGPDENGHTWWESKNGIYDHGDVLRETALVPIEAEEETTERIKYSPRGYEADVYSEVRLVTRWITQDPTESAGEKVE